MQLSWLHPASSSSLARHNHLLQDTCRAVCWPFFFPPRDNGCELNQECMQTCKSTCMCTKRSVRAHSGRAVGAQKCLSQSSAATSGISRAPCAGAAGGFPFYPSGKQALVLQSPACAGALLHAAHSDLADYCREGLNSARAPHALPFSLQLQDSPCLL